MKKGNNVFRKNLSLLFYALKRKIRNKFENFTKHEPMMKAEAVEKTLYLLRRDFNMVDQNDIVITLIKRLHDRREADLIKLQEQMDMMKEQSEKLKEKVIIN
jgi:nucleoside 2-deoxyribosyltransferase